MFRHILVPLDGSTRAEQVLPVAARLARASGGMITLLQVGNLAHEALYQKSGVPYITQEMIDDELSYSRNYLEQVRQRRSLEGIPVQTQVVWGNPAEAIIAQTAEPPLDLIVIASHGYTGVKRWILGSTAERVARHALVPVLILRDGKPLRTRWNIENQRPVRALVPLDTSPRSLDALTPAAELVTALSLTGQGELHLAQIVRLSEEVSATEKEARLLSANQNLAIISQNIRDGLITRFGADLHPVLSWSAEPASDIAEGIVLLATNGEESAWPGPAAPYDLIALTTHGAGGIHRWPVGSIAERVLHLTRLPILVVRPEDIVAKARQPEKHLAKATV